MTTDTAAAMLRTALVPTLAVGAAAALLAGLLVGSQGVWGAVLGGALVTVFFGLGLLVLARTTRLDPALTLVVALGLYVAKVVLIGGTFVLMDSTGVLQGFAHPRTLGLTAIACTLAWTVGEAVGAARTRQPSYDLDTRRSP